jgi:hypothetical protein
MQLACHGLKGLWEITPEAAHIVAGMGVSFSGALEIVDADGNDAYVGCDQRTDQADNDRQLMLISVGADHGQLA